MLERSSEPTDAACGLAAAVGRHERCPGTTCAFWEGPDGCALRAIAPYLDTRQELVHHLLELRARLDEVHAP